MIFGVTGSVFGKMLANELFPLYTKKSQVGFN